MQFYRWTKRKCTNRVKGNRTLNKNCGVLMKKPFFINPNLLIFLSNKPFISIEINFIISFIDCPI